LILAARGAAVSYESIREWGLRFGRIFANTLKRRRPQPGDKWYTDEVFIRIRGKQHYLWRAVDQDGNVLDILVQSRRSATAGRRFFRQLLRGLRYVPACDRRGPRNRLFDRGCRPVRRACERLRVVGRGCFYMAA